MDPFDSFLSENKDKKTVLVTPGGNHGDTLIHMGHVKKLEEHSYDYMCFNLEDRYRWNPILAGKYLANIAAWKLGSQMGFKLVDIPRDVDLILFEGGGYVNDIWYGPTMLNQVLKRNRQLVVVGPQSYRFNTPTIETYSSKRQVHLFCREEASYNHLKQMDLEYNIKVETSPEVALYLKREDIEDFIEPRTGGYELLAFRNDKESALGEDILEEIVEICDNPIKRDVSIKGSMTDFVSTVEHAEKVFTDRLHVAILGTILEKDVTLFGNKYHKNRGVYEYSLKEKVSFIEV